MAGSGNPADSQCGGRAGWEESDGGGGLGPDTTGATGTKGSSELSVSPRRVYFKRESELCLRRLARTATEGSSLIIRS